MRTSRPKHPWWLLGAFWFCVIVAMAVAVRRCIELIRPAGGASKSMMAEMNSRFSAHAELTAAHVVPAAVFVILAVWVLLSRTENRWRERLLFLFGAITGVTAYLMSVLAIGGWIERSAVLVFDSWFLWSLGRAFVFYRQHHQAACREWTTRAVGVLLGIATTRPVMGVFFATSRVTHLTPNQFFGIAFWIGFSINTAGVELWLHSRRRREFRSGVLREGGRTAVALR